jgi:hypothetical protein
VSLNSFTNDEREKFELLATKINDLTQAMGFFFEQRFDWKTLWLITELTPHEIPPDRKKIVESITALIEFLEKMEV